MTNKDFDGYYRRYAAYVRAMLRKRFWRLQKADLEDIEQSVWLKVLMFNGVLDKPASFGTWIYQICTNITLDRFRHDRYWKIEELVTGNTPLVNPVGTTRIEARRILQRLNKKQRNIITLRFIEGLSLRETGVATGMSENNVRVVQHRITRQIRETETWSGK